MTKGIYKISSPSGFYIGSSCRVEERLRQHRADLRAGRHSNSSLQRAFDKHGPLQEEIVLVCRRDITDKGLKRHEQRFIDTQMPRYNQSRLANRVEMTPEICAKISAANKGQNYSHERRAAVAATNRNREWTEEARAKIAKANATRVWTDEARAKTSAALIGVNVGRKVSKATRELLRIAQTGKRASDATRRKLSAVHKGRKHPPELVARRVRTWKKNRRRKLRAQKEYLRSK